MITDTDDRHTQYTQRRVETNPDEHDDDFPRRNR